ncbi:MAG: hypothetical protein LW823_05000 [Rickettsiales bacterium]|jgi:hypothetical protein|nr:hypothetical protein [Rickettsiales bacterium]
MDTEKHLELEKKIREGKSPNDEGPYYHHAWWESYKGSIKGKLLGAVLGTAAGAIIGGVVVAVAAIFTPLAGMVATGAAISTIGAFAGAGLLYGVKEFSEIGKNVGNTASQFRLFESRTRTMVDGKVAEIKEEIGEIKSLLTGKIDPKKAEYQEAQRVADDDETNYRKTHYAKLNTPRINGFAFWKVALVGLVAGAAIGALLGATGIVGYALPAAIKIAPEVITIGSALIFGAMGASFGINRDFARKIADRTDLLFKGILGSKSHDLVKEQQITEGKVIEDMLSGKSDAIATSVVPEYMADKDAPTSQTQWRDKVLPAAQRALLSFDHTRATPQ